MGFLRILDLRLPIGKAQVKAAKRKKQGCPGIAVFKQSPKFKIAKASLQS